MSTVNVTDSSFSDSVLNSDKRFWSISGLDGAALKPLLQCLRKMAQSMGERITVAKINIDENPQTPQQYGVWGSRHIILFMDGQVAATNGRESKASLKNGRSPTDAR